MIPIVPMFAALIGREAEHRSVVQPLRRTHMPARSRVRVVVAGESALEEEVITDTVSQVRLVHLAARAGLRSDDVVLSLGKVEPVLRSLVELKADLRMTIVLRVR